MILEVNPVSSSYLIPLRQEGLGLIRGRNENKTHSPARAGKSKEETVHRFIIVNPVPEERAAQASQTAFLAPPSAITEKLVMLIGNPARWRHARLTRLSKPLLPFLSNRVSQSLLLVFLLLSLKYSVYLRRSSKPCSFCCWCCCCCSGCCCCC